MSSLNARKVAFESAIKNGKKAEEMDGAEWWTFSDVRTLQTCMESSAYSLGARYAVLIDRFMINDLRLYVVCLPLSVGCISAFWYDGLAQRSGHLHNGPRARRSAAEERASRYSTIISNHRRLRTSA
ncbi:hypothetical protein OG21DRAFT_1484409 [Imleria badia]|nr:hypothetical protein OG21DRAFT_1484409 [Imleria badia]